MPRDQTEKKDKNSKFKNKILKNGHGLLETISKHFWKIMNQKDRNIINSLFPFGFC